MLPISVFGPVSWYASIKASPTPVFDLHEHFIKQTWRSRYCVATANGAQILSIPVVRKNHTPIVEVRIDYQKKWPSVHLRTLETAYKKAPFFEHYFPFVERIILQQNEYLVDLFRDGYQWLSPTLILPPINESVAFEPYQTNDYRKAFVQAHPASLLFGEYSQVFNDRLPFIRDLSILDLIFNKGPESVYYLNQCAAHLHA